MATHRQPGIIGLWEEPFPSGGPLPAGGAIDPLAPGPLASTRALPGGVGIAPPDPLDPARSLDPAMFDLADDLTTPDDDGGEDGENEPEAVDQHRMIDFMGVKIKVQHSPESAEEPEESDDDPDEEE